jgi:hypothetical protein
VNVYVCECDMLSLYFDIYIYILQNTHAHTHVYIYWNTHTRAHVWIYIYTFCAIRSDLGVHAELEDTPTVELPESLAQLRRREKENEVCVSVCACIYIYMCVRVMDYMYKCECMYVCIT